MGEIIEIIINQWIWVHHFQTSYFSCLFLGASRYASFFCYVVSLTKGQDSSPKQRKAFWKESTAGQLIYSWLVVWNIFIFHNIWDSPSHLQIFFKMVETTNHTGIIQLAPQARKWLSTGKLKPPLVDFRGDFWENRQTDRPTDRQTDRPTDRQTHRPTDPQTDRQTDRQIDR